MYRGTKACDDSGLGWTYAHWGGKSLPIVEHRNTLPGVQNKNAATRNIASMQQGTSVTDKAKAHKYLLWPWNPENKESPQIWTAKIENVPFHQCLLSWWRQFEISNFVIPSVSFALFPLLSPLPSQTSFALKSAPVCWSRWSHTSTSVTRGHGIVSVKKKKKPRLKWAGSNQWMTRDKRRIKEGINHNLDFKRE